MVPTVKSSGNTLLSLHQDTFGDVNASSFTSTNDVVIEVPLEVRRMAYRHAMGVREGVLRDAPATQAPLAGGAPQHRLMNSLWRAGMPRGS